MKRNALCHKVVVVTALVAGTLAGCGWRGANSLPLPGTGGSGPGSYEIKAQLPNVLNIERNSPVQVGDVTVGNVTGIQIEGWHALVTMRVNGDIRLPANAIAKIGQTSLLGTLHIELSPPPTDIPPEGTLRNGSLIPLSSGSAYPSTEETLAAISMFLNGGGLGQIQDITREFSTAFAGREQDLRSFIEQLDRFIGHLDAQKSDIVAASDSLNKLVGQFADQKPVLDNAIRTIPNALTVLKEDREKLVEALDSFGRFSALTADAVNKTKESLVAELHDMGPVLESLANAGPALTRSLSLLSTYPYPKENIDKFVRGDYANLTGVFDLTLSRIDEAWFTGTRWEGDLTELEMQWGRTIGQVPSPATIGNPLVVPYQFNQGP